MKKKKECKDVKKHEEKYFHIPKKVLWVFIPLWIPVVVVIYIMAFIFFFAVNVVVFLIFLIFGWMASDLMEEFKDLIKLKSLKRFMPSYMREDETNN